MSKELEKKNSKIKELETQLSLSLTNAIADSSKSISPRPEDSPDPMTARASMTSSERLNLSTSSLMKPQWNNFRRPSTEKLNPQGNFLARQDSRNGFPKLNLNSSLDGRREKQLPSQSPYQNNTSEACSIM